MGLAVSHLEANRGAIGKLHSPIYRLKTKLIKANSIVFDTIVQDECVYTRVGIIAIIIANINQRDTSKYKNGKDMFCARQQQHNIPVLDIKK